ncbi:uncharacterized protein EV422DRAFT_503692 [Fimicolochytrium jonesii]|uniref:uncharacterized protein n=1 Tax=Fimicolochytrium jonesii TaxID=1396493 RepID=UPI0022FE5C3F|nr:uncharacterized protein EV422DRAFT_503692 [Fimicolochytrium jonesii]KAI8824908.1 hypothetical protein EV422DRAFT_503692 [Fimicolochytrium jonesii]
MKTPSKGILRMGTRAGMRAAPVRSKRTFLYRRIQIINILWIPKKSRNAGTVANKNASRTPGSPSDAATVATDTTVNGIVLLVALVPLPRASGGVDEFADLKQAIGTVSNILLRVGLGPLPGAHHRVDGNTGLQQATRTFNAISSNDILGRVGLGPLRVLRAALTRPPAPSNGRVTGSSSSRVRCRPSRPSLQLGPPRLGESPRKALGPKSSRSSLTSLPTIRALLPGRALEIKEIAKGDFEIGAVPITDAYRIQGGRCRSERCSQTTPAKEEIAKENRNIGRHQKDAHVCGPEGGAIFIGSHVRIALRYGEGRRKQGGVLGRGNPFRLRDGPT